MILVLELVRWAAPLAGRCHSLRPELLAFDQREPPLALADDLLLDPSLRLSLDNLLAVHSFIASVQALSAAVSRLLDRVELVRDRGTLRSGV